MKYVKQADTWHTVVDDAKPTPAMIATSVGTRRDGRPALTAKCGQQVHTGTFDAPIDDGERCAACAEHEEAPAVVAPEAVDEALAETENPQ